MENFVVVDRFYSEIEDLIEDILDWEAIDDISELPEDYELEIWECFPEPIVKLSLSLILDRIDDERFPEDNERIGDQLINAIKSGIDFDKINTQIPVLYYPQRKK